MKFCFDNLAIFDCYGYAINVFWMLIRDMGSFINNFVELVDHKSERNWSSMARKIANEVLIVSVLAVLSLQINVLYLASEVFRLFIHVKTDILGWSSLGIVALSTVWHHTVNIEVNPFIPGKAEANCSLVSHAPTCSSHSHFGQGSVLTRSI